MSDFEPLVPDALLRHESFLRNLAYGLLGDEHASEDVVQATWLAALEERSETVRNPRAWLARVARNLALTLHRSNKRRRARDEDAAQPEALGGAGETVAREHMLRSVTDAVLALDEPYRSTIMLRFFEGYEAREIALRQKTPVATVRSRIARGLEQLRGTLDRDHGDRSAWALALVPLIGGERIAAAASLGSATTGVTAGTLIMNTKLKLALVCVVLCTGLIVLWKDPWSLWRTTSNASEQHAALEVELSAPEEVVTQVEVADAGPIREVAERLVEPGEANLEEQFGSVRVRVKWHDGTPAAFAPIQVVSWSLGDIFHNKNRRLADEHGVLVFDELVAGSITLYSERGPTKSIDIEPGREDEVEFVLPRGLDLSGIVLDPLRNPVADAEIWLSESGNGTEGMVAMTSGPDGRFFMRDVNDQLEINARAPRFGPSPAFRPVGSIGETIEAEFLLQKQAASLRVLVVDQEDEPLAGVSIKITELEFRAEGYGERVHLGNPIPYNGKTDANGTFDAPHISPGRLELKVSRPDHAPVEESVTIPAGRLTEHRIQLGRGAVVEGVVASPDGYPLEGVSLQIGSYGSFTSRRTTSAEDGSYRLEGVPTGRIRVSAEKRDVGEILAEFETREGRRTRWDPVIDPGRIFAARLLDEAGGPLVNWMVSADENGSHQPGYRASMRTDSEGRFRLLNCPDKPLFLRFAPPRARLVFWTAIFEGVSTEERDRDFIILEEWMPTSTISGRLIDVHGRPIGAEVSLRRPDRERAHSVHSDHETGDFTLGPLAPGTYRLKAHHDDTRASLEVTLGSNVEHEIGDLRLGGAGTLVVNVGELPEGIEPERVRMTLTHEGTYVDAYTATTIPSSLSLPAGAYRLRLSGSVLAETHEFVIASEETSLVELTPRRATRVSIAFPEEQFAAAPGEVGFVVRDADGALVWEDAVYLYSPQMDHYFATLRIPPGDGYEVEFTTSTGLTGLLTLTKAELDSDPRKTPPRIVLLQ